MKLFHLSNDVHVITDIYLPFQRIKVHHKLKRQSIGGSTTATPGDTGFTAAAIAAAKRQSG